mgnify:CR=1 FL=1
MLAKGLSKRLIALGLSSTLAISGAYLVAPLRWVQNDLKKPNQIPKPWDIIIFSVPKSTWHIAVVYGATPWVNGITIFEQNWGRWSTTWQGVDACRLRKVTYANVYWWRTW